MGRVRRDNNLLRPTVFHLKPVLRDQGSQIADSRDREAHSDRHGVAARLKVKLLKIVAKTLVVQDIRDAQEIGVLTLFAVNVNMLRIISVKIMNAVKMRIVLLLIFV